MEEVRSMKKAKNAFHAKTELEKHLPMKGAAVYTEILKQLKKGDRAAVVTYNNYITSLLSVHTHSPETLNWDDYSNAHEPKLPLRQSLNQDVADQEYRSYAPTILDKIFGQCKKKMSDLMKNTEQAKRYDDLIYNASLKEFRNEYQDWEKGQRIAKGVKNSEPEAYQQAIEFLDPCEQLTQMGTRVRIESHADHVVAHLNFHLTEMIPDYVVSHTPAGKVLKTEMPVQRFHELCHHHICASALRIGREIFAVLPVDTVLVHAYTFLPDATSGGTHKELILSVKLTHKEMQELDFKTLSGPDHLAGFSPSIDFTLQNGFSPVLPLSY